MDRKKDSLYHLKIGEIIVSSEKVIVLSVLGSCVAVCLFSKNKTAGGLIHYSLPQPLQPYDTKESFRYGNIAIAALVEEMQRITGEDNSQFCAKIVGGTAHSHNDQTGKVGVLNVEIARKILSHLKIQILSETVGGLLGRKILFHIPSGRLQVALIHKSDLVSSLKNSNPATQKPINPHSLIAQTPPRSLKRKVLIVDDSKTIRDLLKRILISDPEIEIIGVAADVIEAENIIKQTKPDVITLDIHMPIMSGVEWLEKILPTKPFPVVMISSLQLQEGNEVFRALELGAVDYIQKPTLLELPTVGPLIREKVKAASFAKVIQTASWQQKKKRISLTMQRQIDSHMILAIGASTGGTEALKSVLLALPEKIPPILIVQHIPPVFSKAFADRLNDLCLFEVKEAVDGDELKANRVLIAPGGKQMKVQVMTNGYCVRVTDDAPVNRHKPSVDYLFQSIAKIVGKKSIGVILTGMGSDGAKGLLEMRNSGARTISQNEESCVVYGMPRVAFEIGAVESVLSLEEIPNQILSLLSTKRSA